jgi:hypothetical protein
MRIAAKVSFGHFDQMKQSMPDAVKTFLSVRRVFVEVLHVFYSPESRKVGVDGLQASNSGGLGILSSREIESRAKRKAKN